MTKQRKRVLDVLKNSCMHLTADQIFTILKEEGESMVFATVYNSLNYLVDNGYIRRLHIHATTDHYDGNLMPHDHFFCNKCGSVIDIPSTKMNLKKVDTENQIESYEMIYYGICKTCLDN